MVALVAAICALIAVGVLIVALATGGGPGAGAGCVQVTAAGNTGGYVLRSCGADARTFCHEEASRTNDFARAALAACRRSHIAGI